MFSLFKITGITSLFAILIMLAPSAQAATVSYTFNGTADSGLLSGESYTGGFSFINTGLTNTGSESVFLSTFSLSFLSSSYGLGVADVTPTAEFFNGTFLGISYISSASDPVIALVASGGTGLVEDVAYFSYDTVSGEGGLGSLTFTQTSSVPEPSSIVIFALGVAGLRLARRHVNA